MSVIPQTNTYNALKFQIVNAKGDTEVECQILGKTFATNSDVLRAWLHGQQRLTVFVAKANDDEIENLKGHEQQAIVYSAKTGIEANIRIVSNTDYEVIRGGLPHMDQCVEKPNAWRIFEACCFSMRWVDIQYLVGELAPIYARCGDAAEYRDAVNSQVSEILQEEINPENSCFLRWVNIHIELVNALMKLGSDNPAMDEIAELYPELGSAEYHGAAATELLEKITIAVERKLTE